MQITEAQRAFNNRFNTKLEQLRVNNSIPLVRDNWTITPVQHLKIMPNITVSETAPPNP